ncbi:MAG: hypothetical protein K6U04_12865 [Armatimonadetes bacterium]|nr:hypothetical protein [Armatimonadota bacterium]
MAYENGYEAVNYIGSVIERYRSDSMIFAKAAQLIPIFTTRPDWPHSFGELNEAVGCILGESLTWVIHFTERYISDERIIWPDDLPQNFKNDLRAFHIAASSLVNQYWAWRVNPFKLFSVAFTEYGENKRIIRFVRMDGAHLDLGNSKRFRYSFPCPKF